MSQQSDSSEPFSYWAEAIYSYTASRDDPNELSFTKGEILDITDKQGIWWQARKADGTTGIVPSDYLKIISNSPVGDSTGGNDSQGKGASSQQPESVSHAKAIFDYTASPDDPNELSFTRGELFDIIDKQGKWWEVRKADGTIGIVPRNYLLLNPLGPESILSQARALYSYTASPDDPNELSFTRGEMFDIIDRQGKWWEVRKADGTIGIVPRNYLLLNPLEPESILCKARALYSYTASPDDPNELSFSRGEVLEIINKEGIWWQAQKADGTIGIAPSNYLQII